MFTLNIGDDITILPGARYQNLTTSYKAMRGETVPGGIQGKDTTVTLAHGYWLPMVHARYKPLGWLQIHFAYTNTLNYADYSTITPRYFIGPGFISYNNFRIKPARAENFDIVASVYANEVGLFSINGFKKRIKDLIFPSKVYLTDLSAYPDLPQNRHELFEFNTYINNPIPIDVIGLEAEWQTHFWYLPAPLSGFVFNINYTHIFSKASYPKSVMDIVYYEDGTYTLTIIDTFYTTRLLNQPNDILNLALGFDYGGFSARLSLLYQDNIFKRPDFWMQNRVNSDKFARWDLSVKQELPWFGMQVFLNLNNITGENDVDINQKTSFPASEQRYGMTADAGLRLRF
jgi:TonB-dependent receptor